MINVTKKWDRVARWFAILWTTILNLGKESQRKSEPVSEPVSVKRDNIEIYDVARELLGKRKKFKIGDILEWIPECKMAGVPLLGDKAIVVGFDLPKISSNQGINDPIINLDIKLLVQHTNGNFYIFPYESWRFKRVGSFFVGSETKKKKSAKKSKPKKKSAPKKKSKSTKKVAPNTVLPTNTNSSIADTQMVVPESNQQPTKIRKRKIKETVTADSVAA